MLGTVRKSLPAWALTAAIAVFVYWLMREQVLDAYPVPSGSMEPTIEGDPNHGDVVLVDKTFDNRARPQRFDTIVFRRENEGRIVVKRVVGLPGEYVKLENYDLLVGDTRQSLRPVRKDAAAHADLLAVLWDSARSPDGFSARAWRHERTRLLPDGGLELSGAEVNLQDLFAADRWRQPFHRKAAWRAAWNLTWNANVTTGYLDGFDRLREGRFAFDFGVDVLARAEPRTMLWIDLRYGDLSLCLRYDARGEISLWRDGEPVPHPEATHPAPPLSTTRARALGFLYLDRALQVAVDGDLLTQLELPFDDLQAAVSADPRQRPRNGLALAAQGGRAVLERLAVVHDFHYFANGNYGSYEAERVPPGRYFVLGDNSLDSKDSRNYGTVPGEDIIGRPIAVAAPWRRMRWIRR